MSLEDFCNCEFDEFESIVRAWQEMRNGNMRGEWERMRTLAAIIIQPHVKKRVTPRQLIPLPWDRKSRTPTSGTAAQTPAQTPEERRRRFEEVVCRLGDQT